MSDLTEQELLEKAAHFCAYQERAESDVRRKLRSWNAGDETCDKIIIQLREQNYLDDQRFALSFVRGRFGLKKWGRIKIRHALYQHGISADLAEKAIQEIDEELYMETLRELLQRKARGLDASSLRDKSRIYNYLRAKGFEYELINICWEDHNP